MLDKKLFQTRHNAIYDPEFQKHLANAPWKEWLSKPGYFEVKEEYLEKIHAWIHSTKLNEVKGLERFKHRDMIQGTTQAFDEAYYRYSKRRLRMLRGEYAYHRRIVKNFAFLDDENGNYIPLEENDWVITSYPFCGNGSIPPHFDVLQDDCLKKNVPLLLDCAWFGTCEGIIIDVYHPAITEVCFSLTKGIGLGNIRSGIRYSNYEDNLPIRQQNNYNHLPLGAAQVGIWQMEKFGPDFIPDKYLVMQNHICQVHSLIRTNCMMIAMLDEHHADYEHYLIDGIYSKVGIREAIKKQRRINPNPVFCRAPFTSVYYKGSNNSVAFCCAQDDREKLAEYDNSISKWWNSTYAKEMRKSFIDGNFPKISCAKCEWQESNGMSSDRVSFRNLPLSTINVNEGIVEKDPQYLDYRPDNLCNLMCTMCSPSNSNLIEKIYRDNADIFGYHVVHEYQDSIEDRKEIIFDSNLINKDLLKLKVLGGEPTINKKVHRVFEYCIDKGYAQNIELLMTSNFTNLNATYKYLDHFKTVKNSASVDATGPTYEYIRQPAKWRQVKKNILEFNDRYKDNKKFKMGMNCVFQLASAFTVKDWLPELLTFYYDELKIKKNEINMDLIDPTGGPLGRGLTFASLPPRFKEIVISDLTDVHNQFKNHENEDLKKNITDMIVALEYQKYDYQTLLKGKLKIATLDKAKGTDLRSLHPLYKELLEYEE